jgi:hypothetical protein
MLLVMIQIKIQKAVNIKIKYHIIFMIIYFLNSCVPHKSYNTCNIIENPSLFLKRDIKILAIIIYDEHPQIYSTEICQNFNHKNKYISAAADFSDEKLMQYIYKSREMSFDNVRYGSKLEIVGEVKKSESVEQRAVYYIDIKKYQFKTIVKF